MSAEPTQAEKELKAEVDRLTRKVNELQIARNWLKGETERQQIRIGLLEEKYCGLMEAHLVLQSRKS